ncbi:MAG: amino acid adenylation domain-containing protein [Pseudonocardiaceae bacterium]
MSGDLSRFLLSPQQRMAWLSRCGSGEAGAVVAVEGGVDAGRLVEAFERVVGRHEVLQTSLTTVGGLGLPLQVVGEASVMRVEFMDDDDRAIQRFQLVGPCVVVDSMSFQLILEELAALYAGPGEDLGEVLQYVDYTGWVEDLLRSQEGAQGRAFWDLGPDKPGIVEGGEFRCTGERTARQRLEVTVDDVDLLAAWLVLVSARLSDDSGEWMWIRADGRGFGQLQGAVGPYSRWLPLRTTVHRDESSGRLRDRLAARLEAMQARAVFFDDRIPGSGVGFWFERWEMVHSGGLTWSIEETWRECEGLGLVLRAAAGARGVEVWLEFDEQEWPSGEVERLLGQFVQVVGRLAERQMSGLPVGDLLVTRPPVVPETAVVVEGPVGSVLRVARETPSQVAVESGDRAWRYDELVQRARRVATAVREVTGGRLEARVGVCVGQSLEGVAALLGVWGAGAVAVLLEPSTPQQRMTAQITAAKLSALVAGEGVGMVARWDGRSVDVTAQSPVWEGPVGDELVQGTLEEAAYVMFTSGTTGAPKAVEVTHGALGAYAASLRERLAVAGGERWELVTTLAADLGYSSVLGALTSGGTLVVRTAEQVTDWRAVGGCDYLKITPGHLQALVAAAADNEIEVLPGKGLLVGGQAWGWELWQRVRELRPDLAVWNHYGPTETTIGVIAGRVERSASGATAPLLGEPLGHARLYVLDPTGDPVLDGTAGELWVAGPSVARGYVNQPAATAERFRPDPWGPAPGGRMYGTGDLVRRTPDGRYQFLGRIDEQLKIRGHRVEPGEIESALHRHPGVGQAAVVGAPTSDGRTGLVAYLAGPADRRPRLAELRDFLAEWLPGYMIPVSVVWRSQLPFLPNGKIDRACLLETTGEKTPARDPYEVPHPGTEAILAEVWAATLGLTRVGRLDNFFALGGDSIASIQVVARAQESGLQITAEQIFSHPRLADLAQVAAARMPDPAPQRTRSGPVPMTPIQRWFFAEHGPEPHHYNQAFWLDAAEPVDPAALGQAFAALVQRHDTLRLRFLPSLAGWDQELVDVSGGAEVEVIDLSDLSEREADAATAAAVARLQAAINLGHPPMMRMALFRFAASNDRLLWIAHHLIVDVVSWTVLFEQLQRVYLQVLADEAVDPGLATAPFAQWARYLAASGAELARRADASEWIYPDWRHVEPLPVRDPPALPGVVGDEVTLHRCFSEEETRDLLEIVCPAYGLQPLEVVLSLLVDAVTSWSGKESVLVDVEWHGREGGSDAPDVSRTVGWFTTRAPLLLNRPAPNSPDTLLKAVKEQVRRFAQHRLEYGLLRWVVDSRELAGLPNPEISFNFLGRVDRSFPTGSPFRSFAEVGSGSRAASTPCRFRFTVNTVVVRRHLEVDWSYRPSVDDADVIDGLVRDMRLAARAIADTCRDLNRVYTPSDFAAASLTQNDVDRLIQQWNERFS